MNKNTIVKKTLDYAKQKLSGEGTGHDFWHVYRVWKMAIYLAKKEKADLFVVQLAALLHDIADWKFNDSEKEGSALSRKWLQVLKVDEAIIIKVCGIIDGVSFKGAGVTNEIKSVEGKVVQDADRLDALGAIGIARTFAYGGYKQREIHNPTIKPKLHKTFSSYKKSQSTSLNHFYEKLLLLKNLMNTKTAKEIAQHRHEFMEQYLREFYQEWEAKNNYKITSKSLNKVRKQSLQASIAPQY
ncbi:phosphohydrolase [Candidatus Falkowbacteria bacterium CG23_combo_of_CG06-09_8_20_14_all_41_10]|uniref:Phosphohydrolase n=1 Tax=Candidatus Falkowbacteria bacterium CG23_combo_of_CG06-09_8_20_14_all_41_10 TaxID=1974571 RepID=A0A2G9ZMQ9_9BACT|nr:MAG: phosphohydrolase [Candidatus Falkowbacteria bacterium CG23_combo_of_CG06-09_8_20_14_all_41_10]